MRSEWRFLQVSRLKSIFKVAHVVMNGLFFEKHLVVKIDFGMSVTIPRRVVKNYASTSVKRGV
jgi:hypothetical protein